MNSIEIEKGYREAENENQERFLLFLSHVSSFLFSLLLFLTSLTLILLFFLNLNRNLIATYFDQFALINTSREEIRPSPPSPLPKKEKKI